LPLGGTEGPREGLALEGGLGGAPLGGLGEVVVVDEGAEEPEEREDCRG
jgi:hypothetical protein